MSSIGGIIQFFKYKHKNKIETIELNYGQKWSDVSIENKILNSIFSLVDDGDGIIQAEELNMLNKVMLYIDKYGKEEGVIEKKELKEFQKQLKKGEINLEEIMNQESDTSVRNWSEGLDRNLNKISIAKKMPYLKAELEKIAEQEGFTIEEIESAGDVWIEDSSIRRSDGRRYVSLYDAGGSDAITHHEFKNARNNVSNGTGTRVFCEANAFYLEIDKSQIYYGTSYWKAETFLIP